jgi:hypothetical protein
MTEESRDAALAALHAAQARKKQAEAAVKTAEDQVTAAVAIARTANVTWQRIADVLGVEQPNAVRKYRPLLSDLTVRQWTVRE